LILVAANNAGSTLAQGLPASGAGSTTVVLATGTGALFPTLSGSEAFKLTMLDAATETLTEILLVTAISADTLTVIRGQEGTTARAWNVGDLANNFWTAGTFEATVQADQFQLGTYDLGTAGGTGGAWTASLPSDLTELVNGMRVRLAALNTQVLTLNLTLGATATGVIDVVMPSFAVAGGYEAVAPGVIPAAGFVIELTYNTVENAWVMSPIAHPELQARAWIHFDGATIIKSANIATWTRASAGVYNFTFANELIDSSWGITWGSDGTIATALASVGASPTIGGGTINGFDTNTGAAKDVAGTVVFWDT
jgi:hypothetical protein